MVRRFLATLLIAGAAPCIAQTSLDRVHLKLDTAEAHAVLAILETRRASKPVSPAQWDALFKSEGYQRLKVREDAMRRTFTDSAFAAFVTSDTLAARAGELRRTLDRWSTADLRNAAQKALAYLPQNARINATIYVMVKPQTNSFVWDTRSNPAIFLYLDPQVPASRFANTVAHELHHIGFASIGDASDSLLRGLSDRARAAATWMGAFGEGFAMLAAAGGENVHPHAASDDSTRARWDREVATFNQQVDTLSRFFSDVLSGRLSNPDSVRAAASKFYGVQGPWYTVGWKMAVTIERRFGREELIRCMSDPGRLVAKYNDAAREAGLAVWPDEVVRAVAR